MFEFVGVCCCVYVYVSNADAHYIIIIYTALKLNYA